MRLISAVRRAEVSRDRALRRGASAPRARGVVWSRFEARVDPLLAAEGEHVAVDIEVSIAVPGRSNPHNGLWVIPTCEWAIRERFAAEPGDLGSVSMDGRRIGRVVAVYARKVDVLYLAGCDPCERPEIGAAG